jgi:hypothetical protein
MFSAFGTITSSAAQMRQANLSAHLAQERFMRQGMPTGGVPNDIVNALTAPSPPCTHTVITRDTGPGWGTVILAFILGGAVH